MRVYIVLSVVVKVLIVFALCFTGYGLYLNQIEIDRRWENIEAQNKIIKERWIYIDREWCWIKAFGQLSLKEEIRVETGLEEARKRGLVDVDAEIKKAEEKYAQDTHKTQR